MPNTPRDDKAGRAPGPDKDAAGRAANAGSTSPKAFDSRQAAADQAERAAERAGRKPSELTTGSPGEEGPAPGVPSSLDLDRRASAARTGREELKEREAEHHAAGPAVSGGDLDADWASAYSVGDEAPGGDNPTPDQDIVDDVGRAVGVEYQDTEELKGVDKVEERDRHRWELDPASSEDYKERNRGDGHEE